MSNESRLMYHEDTSFCPIPPSEQNLITAVAEPWLKVDQKENNDLEGLSFDREGNLWYVESVASRIHKVDVETKEDVVVYADPQRRGMSASKHHKDGRIYIPSVGPDFKSGFIFTMNPDGSDYATIQMGQIYDDLTFDSQGGFYYTHFSGNVTDPSGSVCYVTPDQKRVIPVLENLQGPNGVALSTDGTVLWVTETAAGRLLRVKLAGNPTEIGPTPCDYSVPYKFTGCVGPDSCEIDRDDNLYVAMYGQGRVMIFNFNGYPIGQVLLPGRDKGRNLASTHCMVRPGTTDLYICTNDPVEGAWIFKAGAFAGADENNFAYR